MNNIAKRSLALLMAIVMCIGLLPVIEITADAATVDYVYSGNYIYNWGTRGTTATFLSPNAEAFYTGSNTYDVLSGLEGSSNTASVPQSALYEALHTLMYGNLTSYTSYDATRPLFRYTDCENNGDPKTISSFYSGNAIGPEWDSGNTWNREHVWPNSKSAGGSGSNGTTTRRETDIMMLRPTATSENGSRGNKAYGESSGYYYPNTESGGTYDVRGDVARVALYVYVCWGTTSYEDGCLDYMWGSNGVIESKEVLLKWMEADPVDTWELGRNDSVESITGTRNVFVDYPELAFTLLGEEVPADMVTPSGEAGNGDSDCEHSYTSAVTAPSCAAEGYTTYTCTLCGRNYKADKVPALGHSYENGSCTVCGEAKPAQQLVTIYYPAGDTYVTSTASGSRLAASASAPTVWTVTEDDDGYVSFAAGGKYMTSGDTGNSLSMSDTLTDCGRWEVIECDGGVYLRNVGANYKGTYNQYLESYYSAFTTYGLSDDSNTKYYTFQLLPLTTCDINGHSWADATVTAPKTCAVCGATEGEALGESYNVSFVVPEGVTAPAGMTCNNLGITLPTVTAPEGYTFLGWVGAAVDNETGMPATVYEGGSTYKSADETKKDVVLYALYSYTKQEESSGGNEGSSTTVTVSISDYATDNSWKNETKYTTLNMDGVVTVTAAGGSNTGKYYTNGNNWRIYQSEKATLKVDAGSNTIKTVKITYNVSNGGTLTYNSSNIASNTTVNVDASSITFGMGNTGTKTNGQARITAIEVVYTSSGSGTQTVTYYTTVIGENACAHENAALTGVKAPTCTENGYTGDLYCAACQTVLVKGESIAATAHADAEYIAETDSTCKTHGVKAHYYCGACGKDLLEKTVTAVPQTAEDLALPLDPQNHEGDTELRDAVAAEVGKPGYTGDTWCLGCGTKIADGEPTAALPVPPAAKIGDVTYDTFAEAVAAVKNGETIVMLRDTLDSEEPVVISREVWFGVDGENGRYWSPEAGEGYTVRCSGMDYFGYWFIEPVEVPETSTSEPETSTSEPETSTSEPEASTTESEAATEATEESTEATEPTVSETTESEETTEATEPTVPETTEPEEVTEITVKVTVPEGWEDPAIWAWTGDQNAFDAWPGLSLTKGEDGFWYATLPAWVENIIINANGGSVQTADLKLAKTKVDVTVTVSLASDGTVKVDMEYASPETGDGTALTAVALTMLLAAAGFVTTVGGKKKFF